MVSISLCCVLHVLCIITYPCFIFCLCVLYGGVWLEFPSFFFDKKNLQITEKLLKQGYRFHKLVKSFWKFFRNNQALLLKFGQRSASEYISQGISQPVFYGDLLNKIKRVKGERNFIYKCTKIIKRLKYRGYDPRVIKRKKKGTPTNTTVQDTAKNKRPKGHISLT